MQTGGNAVLSGQQKQQKVVAARLSCTMPCGFFKWSLRAHGLGHYYWQGQWDFLLTLKIESLHQGKLAKGADWHEHDQWKMTPPSWPVSSVRKVVRRTELSLSLNSMYFGWWFKIIFCRLHGSCFVVELQVQSTLFCFSANSKLRTALNYFCTGFSVAQIALFCRRNSIHS